MSIGSGAGALLGTGSGIQNLAQSLADRLGGTAQTYFQQLRQASFANFGFVSLGGEAEFGRRNELHEYPKRDTPWVEDLGRATRRIRMTGFIVGDDVIKRRDSLINLLEKEGPATLIHPTLGERKVSVMEFRTIERWERGRYFEFEFDFVEGGPRVFPSTTSSTPNVTKAAADALGIGAAVDFARLALTEIAYGASVLQTAVNTALGWYTTATNYIGDARNLFKLLTDLPGEFGRFIGSSIVPRYSQYPSSSVSSNTTVASLTASAVTARVAVQSAAAAVGTAAASLDKTHISAFSTAAQALPTAMLAAIDDPADQVRIMTSLAGYAPSGNTTSSTIGTAMAGMQTACGDLFRRAAIAAVCTASANYEPSSSDDAATMRTNIVRLLDREMKIAGDQGSDSTYDALRTLRTAVINDLNARGAGLANMRTFTMNAPLPAIVLANRLYRDATRENELVSEINPVHPAFCPTTFRALSQ